MKGLVKDLLENTNDPRLRLVKDEVVNLEIAMDQSRPVSRLLPHIRKVLHHLLEERQLADSLARIHILDLGLGGADSLPGGHLTAVEAIRLAELLQPDALGVDAVQLGQNADGIAPDGAALVGEHVGYYGILEDAAVKEGHDVKGGADDGLILAQAVGPRHGHVGVGQGSQDAVLALDLVGRLGHQLSWRLLAEDIFPAVGGSQLVGRVGLTKAELYRGKSDESESRNGRTTITTTHLLNIQRRLDVRHLLGQP